MAHINLLPWREEERKRKKNEFYSIVGAAVAVMALVVLGTHMYIASLIDYQISRNEFLKQEIVYVEKKIREIRELEKKKEQLISRMRIIERLQGNRPEVVHLFDELAKIIPEGLYITSLDQQGKNVVMKGTAQSNARVSAFMRALEESGWFDQPQLDVISTQRSGVRKDRAFTLRVKQKNGEGD
jgi:type IV pilus assembly protein PilN